MVQTMDQTPKDRRRAERLMDPAGVVRRGGSPEFRECVREYTKNGAEMPKCHVGGHPGVAECRRPAGMEVYGLLMCEAHGEEAALLALEEMAYDLEQEFSRPLNDTVRELSPHVAAAFGRGMEVLRSHDHKPADEALLAAWPLVREDVSPSTLGYLENPEGWRSFGTPFDVYMEERMLTHRLMRLAFEAGADWLVVVLEREREKAASQAAYALVLDRKVFGKPA